MALTDVNSEDRLQTRKMGTANVLVVTLAKGSFGADFMVLPGRSPILFKQWGGKNRNRLVVCWSRECGVRCYVIRIQGRACRSSHNALIGRLPPRVLGLVMEWAALHRQELMDDWELARRQIKLKRIAPLE